MFVTYVKRYDPRDSRADRREYDDYAAARGDFFSHLLDDNPRIVCRRSIWNPGELLPVSGRYLLDNVTDYATF